MFRMRMSGLGLCVGLALGASLGSLAAGQESPLTEADRQAFAWFDGLGFPACAGRPFVCLTRNAVKPKEGEHPYSTSGFLLEESHRELLQRHALVGLP